MTEKVIFCYPIKHSKVRKNKNQFKEKLEQNLFVSAFNDQHFWTKQGLQYFLNCHIWVTKKIKTLIDIFFIFKNLFKINSKCERTMTKFWNEFPFFCYVVCYQCFSQNFGVKIFKKKLKKKINEKQFFL